MRRIGGAVAAIMILLAGIFGAVIAVFDLIGLDYHRVFNKSPEDIALLILALIATTLGIDYLVSRWGQPESIRQLVTKMTAIENHLLKSVPVRRLSGTPAIYSDGVRLVKSADRHIRSVVVGEPNKAPMAFTRAVANRLRELKEAGTPARFDAVMILDEQHFDLDALRQRTAHKTATYEKAGLAGLVSLKAVSQSRSIGFDVLIVDQKHVHIAFPSIAGAQGLMTGLIFEDQPDVAREFAHWFDQRVWPSGTSVLDV